MLVVLGSLESGLKSGLEGERNYSNWNQNISWHLNLLLQQEAQSWEENTQIATELCSRWNSHNIIWKHKKLDKLGCVHNKSDIVSQIIFSGDLSGPPFGSKGRSRLIFLFSGLCITLRLPVASFGDVSHHFIILAFQMDFLSDFQVSSVMTSEKSGLVENILLRGSILNLSKWIKLWKFLRFPHRKVVGYNETCSNKRIKHYEKNLSVSSFLVVLRRWTCSNQPFGCKCRNAVQVFELRATGNCWESLKISLHDDCFDPPSLKRFWSADLFDFNRLEGTFGSVIATKEEPSS